MWDPSQMRLAHQFVTGEAEAQVDACCVPPSPSALHLPHHHQARSSDANLTTATAHPAWDFWEVNGSATRRFDPPHHAA
eukprot:354859-Chlamydomonas_euryale.AAC.12